MVSSSDCVSWGCCIDSNERFNRVAVEKVRDGFLCSLCQLGLLFSQCWGSSRGAVESGRNGDLTSLCQLGCCIDSVRVPVRV